MANISGQMDEIFDDGLEFDVIFDHEDKLIDQVAGIKEDGTPVLGDEYAGFFDENGDFIEESEFSIPGEPTTDDGKSENKAGKANLLDRTTSDGCPSVKQHLNRDAESDGTSAAPNSSEAQVDDMESPSEFRKDLDYVKEEDDVSLDDYSTDDGKNDESANNSAAKTTMSNGQNQQKVDDNSSVKEDVDAELFDESVLEPTVDELLFNERVLADNELDAELLDESVLHEEDEDIDEELVDAVEDNDSEVGSDLDYEDGVDDAIIDELL